MLLPNQKHLFSLPDDVHYLNCATMSPLLKSVEQAGINGILQKSQPYLITADRFFDTLEIVKNEFAKLINCPDSQRIAVMGSASYGMATMAKNILKKGLAVPGKKIVMVGEEFPTCVYAWDELKEKGVTIEFVAAPESLENRGKIWNERLLATIDNQTLLVCLSPVHWSDGTLFDLPTISRVCQEKGAFLVVDGTQFIGAYPFDIQAVKVDILIVAAYKWLLGPYGNSLVYLSEWFDDGVPLEQNWAMRKDSDDFKNLIDYQSEYRPKAYRYNIGEMSNFINLPMIAEALKQLNEWTPTAIQDYAKSLITNDLETIRQAGYWVENQDFRANHLFGIRLPQHIDLPKIQQKLLTKKVYVAYRGTAIRVSVHLWNSPEDVAALVQTLCE